MLTVHACGSQPAPASITYMVSANAVLQRATSFPPTSLPGWVSGMRARVDHGRAVGEHCAPEVALHVDEAQQLGVADVLARDRARVGRQVRRQRQARQRVLGELCASGAGFVDRDLRSAGGGSGPGRPARAGRRLALKQSDFVTHVPHSDVHAAQQCSSVCFYRGSSPAWCKTGRVRVA